MTNKNEGSFQAFDEAWFKKHQRGLLFLCNAPIIKYWFRYVLRIHECDCPRKTKITQLGPNRFSWGDKIIFNPKDKTFKRERTTDFRTHDKFAKRIYFAFKPMWWAFHYWDILFANNFQPAWNLGFDTLTVYPDAGSGGSVCVDGYAKRDNGASGESLATIRAGAGTTASATLTSLYVIMSASTNSNNRWAQLRRTLTCLNTASLGAGATISNAVLSGWGSNIFTDCGTPDWHVAQGGITNTNNVVAGDYAQANHGTTSFGNVAGASIATGAYNNITLSEGGRAAISKIGITIFSWQISWDILNSETGFNFNSGGFSGFYFALDKIYL